MIEIVIRTDIASGADSPDHRMPCIRKFSRRFDRRPFNDTPLHTGSVGSAGLIAH
jgi:hypothetical protein